MSVTALNEPVTFQCEGVTGLNEPVEFCPGVYLPPTMPLHVTWEGTEAYTAPTVPLEVSWEVAADPVGFSPLTYSPSLWMDASDAATRILDGSGFLEAWLDKSGNGRHYGQAHAANRPAIDAATFPYPAISLNGSSQFLENNTNPPATDNNTTGTFFVVFRRPTTGIHTVPLAPGSGTGGYPFYWFTDNRTYVDFGGPNSTQIGYPSAGDSRTGNFVGVTARSGASRTLKVNGSAITLDTNLFTEPGTLNQIGRRQSNESMTGLIAEMILYDTVLTAEQIIEVETYLAQKWGLASSFPCGHPALNPDTGSLGPFGQAVTSLSGLVHYAAFDDPAAVQNTSRCAEVGGRITYRESGFSMVDPLLPEWGVSWRGPGNTGYIELENGGVQLASPWTTVQVLRRGAGSNAATRSMFHNGRNEVASNQGTRVLMMSDGKTELQWLNGSWRAAKGGLVAPPEGEVYLQVLRYNGSTEIRNTFNATTETINLPVDLVNSNQEVWIGASWGTSIVERWLGDIGAFAWFNRELTDQEVEGLYAAFLGGDGVSATGSIVFGATANASVFNTKVSATGAILFGVSAQASAIRRASATGSVVFGASASAAGIFSLSATGSIQFGAQADAEVVRFPAQVTGIAYSATVDSLTFTWSPAQNADTYRARLYRDGVLVETLLPETETVTFTGLEDGTEYIAEIQGVNDGGLGPSGVRVAITVYIAPTAPTNLQQEGDHWILLKVLWDAPPEKVTFYESIVSNEDGVIHKGIVPPTPTERMYGMPKAGQTYTWKIRAGNPGGLSAFAELEVTTRPFFTDSRLAVAPAAYQEDWLFPDTWDGGTNMIAEGVGDPQVSRGMPIFSSPPPLIMPSTDPEATGFNFWMGDFNTNDPVVIHSIEPHLEATGIDCWMGDFNTNDPVVIHSIEPHLEATGIDCWMGDFNTETKMYIYNAEPSIEACAFSVWIGDFNTEVPQ